MNHINTRSSPCGNKDDVIFSSQPIRDIKKINIPKD